MTIPGQNLLKMALTAIFPQNCAWYAFSGRTLNAVGQYVTSYNAPVTIPGSFQPLSRQAKFALGLDWQKSYYTFYTSNNIGDIERDTSPDLFVQGENVYQVESNTQWLDQDKWVGSLVVKTNLAVPSLTKEGLYIAENKKGKK